MAIPTDSLTAAALVEAESVVRRSGSSFYWAMRSLSADARRAMYALYAFCRDVDDIADDPATVTSKRERLAAWRAEVDRLFRHEAPSTPLGRALAFAIQAFALERDDLLAIIAGMEMDAATHVRIADARELALYCDRVAGAVGRLSVRIFGVAGESGTALASALGEALQLTNILRDLDEDAERDRLYLPLAMLRAHGIDATEPRAVLNHPALPGVCATLAEGARTRFAEAVSALARLDRRRVHPAVVMMEVYRRVLDRLIRRGWRRLSEPVRLSSWHKLWVLVRYGMV